MARGHGSAFYGLLLVAALVSGCAGGAETFGDQLPFEDDFSGSCEDWPARDDEQAQHGCTGGQYRVLFRNTAKSKNWVIVRDMDESVQSIGLEADASLYAAPRTSPNELVALGLVCGTSSVPGSEQGYFLYVAPHFRMFAIDKVDNTNLAKRKSKRLDEGPLPSSATGGTGGTNHLRAECRQEGDQAVLTMWVNGEQVAVAKDPHGFHGYITFGFLASSPKAGADFRFDNFIAEELN